MIDLQHVNRVVDKAAAVSLKRSGLSRVYSEPAMDSEGREALLVTIVLRSDAPVKINGARALNTIVRIQRDLRRSGEERFPIIDFVTEDELASDVSS